MDTINSEIAKIWCKYNNNYTDMAPLFYPEFNKEGFLGIGLNPSFDEEYLKGIFEQIGITEEPKNFFYWKRIAVWMCHKKAGQVNRQILQRSYVWMRLNKYAKKADLTQHIGIHTLRRAFQLCRRDVNITRIKYLLNHYIGIIRAQKNIDKYIKKNVDMEEIARGKNGEAHKFYKPFFEVAEKIGICPVQVIDMFLIRETDQTELKKSLKKAEVDKDLNKFWKEQFRLFLQIIEEVNPKIILVANAFASEIFKKECLNQLIWQEDKGYHILKLNKVSCPIFFSGMLSGQRPLDTHSKERLIWHMKKALQ